MVSSRFVEEAGSGPEYKQFLQEEYPASEAADHTRLLDNCLAMGSPKRPSAEKGSFWYDWFGASKSNTMDRCRVMITLNMVGAGRGSTILWETNPPPIHSAGPDFWISEQETAATHLERNLEEIDAMCATGQIAARVQVLVCEPIPGKWTDWMDSKLVNCGGKPAPLEEKAKVRRKEATRTMPASRLTIVPAPFRSSSWPVPILPTRAMISRAASWRSGCRI